MFKLLFSNKVDVVLTNTMDGNAAISRLGLQNIVEMQKPLARLALYHYLHNKHDDLVPFIDKEINRLKANKEIDRLINNAEKRVMNFH
jgi:ABC-type amino acid transport substrate-binding protein